jgi:hypothetical protein
VGRAFESSHEKALEWHKPVVLSVSVLGPWFKSL